jgi:hypothetical protein
MGDARRCWPITFLSSPYPRTDAAVAKGADLATRSPPLFDIHLPGDTYIGVITAVFGTALGVGLVWYMWWLAWLSFAVIAVSLIARAVLGDRHPGRSPLPRSSGNTGPGLRCGRPRPSLAALGGITETTALPPLNTQGRPRNEHSCPSPRPDLGRRTRPRP